jgi:lipid II:glycine glycyltransferase (peptidoglycan interpeptide bridge formation enzyme)
MIYRKPRIDEEDVYDKLVKHPLQSRAWGNFRETTGVMVHRLIGFEGNRMEKQIQVTFHPIPKLPWMVGYYPKGVWPDETTLAALKELGKREKAIFVKLEPDISAPPYAPEDLAKLKTFLLDHGCQEGRPLFTPYTFIIDLSQTEDQLITQLKTKTRYNVKVALKHGVQILEDNSNEGFNEYLELLSLTTRRQQFFAHTQQYQRDMWKYMRGAGIAHLLKATYQGKTLVVWIVFHFNDRLFYPYGASSREHREIMASNLMMWEAIRFGKRIGCKTFDLWGALGPEPDPKDPWYGFHKFKEGYGGALAHFVGTYDLVIDPVRYKLFRIGDRWRWKFLRFKSKLPLVK